MRILVTGAAGFIGSHIAEAYHKAGHEVVGLDNLTKGRRENLSAEIPFFALDLVDEGALQTVFSDFRPQVVSHHAAQVNVRVSGEEPLEDARANILGTLTLMRQATRAGTNKIIYSSSGGAVYGEPEHLPVDENHPIKPLSNYGVSKYCAELYFLAMDGASPPTRIIFRYANVYGPRQDPAGEAGVVAIFTNQLLRGEPSRIFGDGSKTRDYVYVDDIVEANLHALDYQRSGVFNLGCGKEITDLEVFQTVRDAIGSRLEPIFDHKRPGEIERICLDASCARRALGWLPRVEFSDGVLHVVDYWKERQRVNHSTSCSTPSRPISSVEIRTYPS